MDITLLRILSTVLAFVCFLGIVWYAYRRRSQKEWAVAEQLPFADTVSGPQTPDRRRA
ncbi:MAG TPA: CcoQ/FixQ family Cbb3-type cytochrome c oxidase assembly chaperone [Burkholderiaceae bacterium]|nr:CcoQ/FixQ family Cbb3-type cytochrome c oxidase assembly chaperone [Burkholderiaceae bacterium]